MKAVVGPDGKVSFEVEGDSEYEIFKQIARVQEVFDHNKCGKCGSGHTKYVCRLDKDENDWLEVVCQECRAKVIFGRAKKGGVIYPKIRWDQLSEKQQEQRANEQAYAEKHYGYLPHNGWFNFQRES
jgi:hypothetical protein